MLSERKAASAMGGKTARACDGCLRKRAHWYCVADDAFLCQACDSSVHSANQLASRHERVRLETSSSWSKLNCATAPNAEDSAPAWHRGFTRKARTPRHNKSMLLAQQKNEEMKITLNQPVDPLVPEIGSEEGSVDENEELLLCRVPVFDPFAAELCDVVTNEGNEACMFSNEDGDMMVDDYGQEGTSDLDGLHGFLPSDMDLAEFAADVESLLGGGLDEDSTGETKGAEVLLDCKEEAAATNTFGFEHKIVKVKDEGVEEALSCFDPDFDATREELNWNFDYESSPTMIGKEEDEKVVPVVTETTTDVLNDESRAPEMKRNTFLRLNYEAIISAWASQGSPWTTGSRPDFNPDDCYWPDSKGLYGHHGLMSGGMHMGGIYGQVRGSCDGEREARVSRYREKRRTRLFSKKIRYEVRKLNAEKRPRMKGRFVKRTAFVGAAFPYMTVN